jgi:transcriptional regulator with XRE-family HTH domain
MKFETFSRRLGRRLAGIRQDKQMTQAQLAREAGLSLKYVSMIESGTNPSIRTVMKVCDALGTDVADVMEQEGIGSLPGRKTTKISAVQIDLPVDDPQMKKLLAFIRKLGTEDKRRALRLLKTTFGSR